MVQRREEIAAAFPWTKDAMVWESEPQPMDNSQQKTPATTFSSSINPGL